MSLERNLKRAMARKKAPSGFGDRVLDRLDTRRAADRRREGWRRITLRIAAVLFISVLGVGGWLRHDAIQQERHEGERAAALVKLALQITTEKTNIARAQLKRSGTEGTKDDGNEEKTVQHQ